MGSMNIKLQPIHSPVDMKEIYILKVTNVLASMYVKTN
jgi:hypothetical protein